MPSFLIQATLAAGERLRDTLQAENFELAAEFAAARGVLMDRLVTETTPAMHTAADRESLLAQHASLEALLTAHAETMRSSIAAFTQQRQAHASYHAPSSRPSILRSVHG